MWSIFKVVFFLSCPFLLAGYISASIALVTANLNNPVFLSYAKGVGFGSASWCIFGQRARFVRTLLHELSHLLAAALCFRRPVALNVHECGEGQAQMGGNMPNPLISLAPYCIPLAAIAGIPLYLLLRESHTGFASALVGFLLATHWVDVARTFRSYQPDIQQSGMFFSLTFCLVINVLLSAALTSLVANAPSEVPAFILDGWLRCKQIGCEAERFAVQLAEKVHTAGLQMFRAL
jgi:hypothetical protein